ncbi:12532_t:CDS:2 [Entrophospora sp. SA101]|nr:12532_t:CDS:2 [Entrophospora sp. SA101]
MTLSSTFKESKSKDEEEWLNWVADNDTETTIENELYNNGEGFIDTSSKEISNLQNLSAPNKKRLGIGPESNRFIGLDCLDWSNKSNCQH